MKDKIIEIVNEFHDIAITALKKQIPEICGDFDLMLTTKDINDSNILIISGVNAEFIQAITELHQNEIIDYRPVDIYTIMFDQGEIYNLPIVKARKKFKQYKSLHWLPIIIAKGVNFPKIKFKSYFE